MLAQRPLSFFPPSQVGGGPLFFVKNYRSHTFPPPSPPPSCKKENCSFSLSISGLSFPPPFPPPSLFTSTLFQRVIHPSPFLPVLPHRHPLSVHFSLFFFSALRANAIWIHFPFFLPNTGTISFFPYESGGALGFLVFSGFLPLSAGYLQKFLLRRGRLVPFSP